MTQVKHADLTWNQDGQPVSSHFNDIYFSKTSGIEETNYVFIQHNNLINRFKQLTTGQRFVIAETGFGTGLNFLTTWNLFQQVAPQETQLHFISVEKYPLIPQHIEQALALWNELTPLTQQLLNQYTAIHEGYQTFIFDNGRVTLTLLIGDIQQQITLLHGKVDAWFLDGFSPAKNPDMWTPALFLKMATLSHQQTTFATFTSAGNVRRGLTEAGFLTQKDKGFANKREMLFGSYQGIIEQTHNRYQKPSTPPWYEAPPEQAINERTAIIIGAGIAGCSSAYSLAQRGWKVIVLERNEEPALEGSGNAQGILYLKLSAHQTLQSRLLIEGFGYTRRLLNQLTQQGVLTPHNDWDNCGVLQLGYDEKEQKRQQQLVQAFSSHLLYPVDQQQANQLAGLTVNHNGIFFPEGCWVKPRNLCKILLEHPNITLYCNQQVTYLKKEQQWAAYNEQTLIAQAAIVILAGATDSKTFPYTAHLPIKAIKGQTTELPCTTNTQKLNTVVCSSGYISPAQDNKYCVGATFNFKTTKASITPDEHLKNIETLKTISINLAQQLQVNALDPKVLNGRAAFRCTATDYLPVVGPIADRDQFHRDYAILIKDSKKIPTTPCTWIEGLYLNTAHGSRGLITAPLCGELLAAHIHREVFPIEKDLVEACHPNRFYMRELKYFRRKNEA